MPWTRTLLLGLIAGLVIAPQATSAQSRAETLVVVTEVGPNMLDIHAPGANRPSYQAAWNIYDRLITFGSKTLKDGSKMYDHAALKPELAESWQMAPDGMSVTFKLRKDAKFHDGSPVTANDVKWSYDRAVTVGGFPTFQMKAGSLEKPEQFEAVDDYTFRVKFIRKDKLSMPDLGVPVAVVINSKLAKQHATAQDPWAVEWVKQNDAGGGAYKIESWKPGQETVYARFEDWKSGPMPKIRRVIVREIPSAGTRRVMLEKGDADISFDLPPRDFAEMKQEAKLKIVSTPISNGIQYIGMNVTTAPFDKLEVRQAVAYAIPYQKIMDAVMFGLARPLYGAPADAATSIDWPQSHKFVTDIAKAKQLMAEAGYPNGFETTLSFDLGFAVANEPLCILVQESLAQIGIKTTINKVPGANWRTELNKKTMPLFTNVFSGWLDYPEYFFFWCYHGQNAVFNTMNYQSKDMDALIDGARDAAAAGNAAAYEKDVKGFVDLAYADMPRIPLFQPYVNVAMQKNISGYQYWFHRRLDYRALAKG
jgi:peptide/nickel transport system substrate-binding protein